jgi:hypothetical protein
VYLENFHFAYNAIVAGRSNRLESIYSSFAIEVRKSNNKEVAISNIDEKLTKPLDQLYPKYNDFAEKFIKLTFTKKDIQSNVKTKYALNKLNCIYDEAEIFDDTSSIEHILPENSSENSTNIGNLIILEMPKNNELGESAYEEKRVHYGESKYRWIRKFAEDHSTWDETQVADRANKLAEEYFTKVLKKRVERTNH